MRRTKGSIQAHTISPAGRPALRIKLDSTSIPAPGQPLLAYLSGSHAPTRTPLYPSKLYDDGFTSTNIPSPAWEVGSEVDLLGPIGKGFSLPAKNSRWFVFAKGKPIDRLLPVIEAAITSEINIAAFADTPMPDLPAQVEIAADPADVKHWANYIAIDAHDTAAPKLVDLLAPQPGIPPAADLELLLDLAMPCGLGVCSACAVGNASKWRLACQDGPVFKLKDWFV